MRIQQELFGNNNPRVGHDDYDVTYILFPGSTNSAFGTSYWHPNGEITYEAIQDIGQKLWNEKFD